ncbi:MAG: trypsin-like peptidase domain-containing protein [Coriobacteriia bacterium]|nr:trypsin-like peptidase domain-containing protein [Coriobacteriia bacterium]MCL2749466.1 trypsin-like peptidase domain-containing protein [Coriobacteriia bacterium]
MAAEAQPKPGQEPPPQQTYELENSLHAAPPASSKRFGLGAAFILGFLGVLVGAVISVGALYISTNGFSFSGTVDTSTIVIDSSGADIDLPVVVAAKVTPSVVNIDVFANPHSFMLDDIFDEIFGDNALEPQRMGLGSGVILTEDGFILTNFHVVDGGEKFLVRLNNEELEAVIVGSDPSSDLAVIKVEAHGLTPITIGDSEAVSVGEWVMAVGSPFGLEKSVSVGIISALYRSTAMQSQSGLSIFANLIQTDAAINPGNSGGALVNSQGELIGINTLINTTSGSSAGVGFAVPSNFAYSVAQQIMSGEEVAHPYLGIMLFTVDSSNAQELGVYTQSGAYIESVMPDSPAERAGLQPGDVITSIDNQNISTSAELIIEVRRYEIGQTVSLVVNREGQTHKIEVVLGSTAG